jgi:hypothetical protein
MVCLVQQLKTIRKLDETIVSSHKLFEPSDCVEPVKESTLSADLRAEQYQLIKNADL